MRVFKREDFGSISSVRRESFCLPGGLNRARFMAWFYEIRDADDFVLKRDGEFANQDAAKIAARADAKKMKSSPQPSRSGVGRVLVGQNTEKPTRY